MNHPLTTPTDDPNLKLMQDAWKENLRKYDKVYHIREKHFILDEWCQNCGKHMKKLEAKLCPNGFFSWKCQRCWRLVGFK